MLTADPFSSNVHLVPLNVTMSDRFKEYMVIQWRDNDAQLIPLRDPSLDLRAAISTLYIDRRNDTCPVDGEHKACKLIERAVLRVGHGKELGIGRRPARHHGLEMRFGGGRARVDAMEGVELVPAGGE
jgi:hypothetical protein